MNDSQLFDTISLKTSSKTSFLRRLTLLRLFFEKKYFTNSSPILSDFLKELNASPSDIAVLTNLPTQFYESFTLKNFYNLLKNLSEKLAKTSLITVYLPLIPNSDEIENLGTWFRQYEKTDCVIEVIENKNMVAGATYVRDGILHDYSLNYLLFKKRSMVSSLISQYAGQKQSTTPR